MSNETGTSPATQIVYLEKRVAELEEQLDALSQQPENPSSYAGTAYNNGGRQGGLQPTPQVPGDVKHAATMLNCGNTNRDFLVTVVKWVLYTDSVLRSGEGEER